MMTACKSKFIQPGHLQLSDQISSLIFVQNRPSMIINIKYAVGFSCAVEGVERAAPQLMTQLAHDVNQQLIGKDRITTIRANENFALFGVLLYTGIRTGFGCL